MCSKQYCLSNTRTFLHGSMLCTSTYICCATCSTCTQDRPSLRYIRDVLRMRNSQFITLRFESVAELLEALEASGAAQQCTWFAHSLEWGSNCRRHVRCSTHGMLSLHTVYSSSSLRPISSLTILPNTPHIMGSLLQEQTCCMHALPMSLIYTYTPLQSVFPATRCNAGVRCLLPCLLSQRVPFS